MGQGPFHPAGEPAQARQQHPGSDPCPAQGFAASLHLRGIIGDNDRAVLAAYCQAYGRWVGAERKLAETPLLITLPSGYIQQSPWPAIATKQLEIMHKYAAELGLSPVSRSRVTKLRSHE
ncbi:phage terminase small subunit P27 family [Mesorhizobium sp. CN2-181]|uniref:phage terminase small subunit P27 family n=1 Tax=Mesorhizobium yinganensis TaxID=3157707 RepID=UPI0032B76FFD